MVSKLITGAIIAAIIIVSVLVSIPQPATSEVDYFNMPCRELRAEINRLMNDDPNWNGLAITGPQRAQNLLTIMQIKGCNSYSWPPL